MCDKLKLILEQFSDEPETSVLSSVDKTYKGTVLWTVPVSKIIETEKVESRLFSMGPEPYHKFNLLMSVSEVNEEKYVDVFIKFSDVREGMVVYGSFEKVEKKVEENDEGFLTAEHEYGVLTNRQEFCAEKPLIISCTKFFEYNRLNYLPEEKFIIKCEINIGYVEITSKSDSSECFKAVHNVVPSKTHSFLFRQSRFANVKFRLTDDENKEILAHREIVESKIPLIRAMFKTDTRIVDLYEIKNIDEKVFLDLLEYAYTGNLHIRGFEHAFDLYQAAHIFLITELQQLCSAYLALHINEKNQSLLKVLSEMQGDEVLEKAHFEYMLKMGIYKLETTSINEPLTD